ncbi:MAG TPA: sigma-70 family RNA polymerase sigma factor [Vicinamibacteria bacterium]|nr:sigma-70 family RNA polymerase sigma factor [Vicinamibacteria bacterium]
MDGLVPAIGSTERVGSGIVRDPFEDLVRRHGPRLLATARRILRSEDDARDALQDAFLQAFRAQDGFRGEAAVQTWLHRILVNACLMRLRSRRRHPEESIDELLPDFQEDGHHARHPHEWRAEPEVLLERRENREFVRAALDRLPDDYRTVILLRDIEELTTAEAAAALGISEVACKVRLHRARQALRGLLAPHFESRPS